MSLDKVVFAIRNASYLLTSSTIKKLISDTFALGMVLNVNVFQEQGGCPIIM